MRKVDFAGFFFSTGKAGDLRRHRPPPPPLPMAGARGYPGVIGHALSSGGHRERIRQAVPEIRPKVKIPVEFKPAHGSAPPAATATRTRTLTMPTWGYRGR